ncbi:hypothetical protein [Cellulomonas sp. A375-1]|uniref:hypothetical protein n=1 Tax=Cellulomonas sp. A375-1 TaxID=1672219 RepID=UPI00069E974A|nr:hypothetical protein [Cellulomonas sp. A375-1]
MTPPTPQPLTDPTTRARTHRERRTRAGRLLAVAALALGVLTVPAALSAAADDVVVDVTIPEPDALTVSDAQLRWALNDETGGGAFFGGCNFLSAGKAGSAGGSRAWTGQDGLYASRAGDVRIEKDAPGGGHVEASWATRCLDASGAPVAVASPESTTGNEVVIEGGVGTVDAASGTASVRWTGSFTVVFYGGLTYWSATDPVLEVADGTGTLTATLSGFGADRTQPGTWTALTPRTAALAVLEDVEVTEAGLVVVPEYVGVSVTAPAGAAPQSARDAASAAYWGAFPQDFVDFQGEVGQAPYWYSTGGARDRAKPAAALVVSFDASRPVPPPAADDDDQGGGPAPTAGLRVPENQVRNRPAGGVARPALGAHADGGLTAVAPQVPASSGAQALSAQPVTTPGPDEGGLLDGLLDDPLALGALGASVVAAAAGALGLRQGWVVLPWVR